MSSPRKPSGHKGGGGGRGRGRGRGETAEEPLHAAARAGDLSAVQSICTSNPLAINSRDRHSRTPLHLAAWSGHGPVVSYLCMNNADVGAAAMDDMGAIHFASQKGHLEVVRILLSSGVSVNAVTRKGFTPLHYSAQGSHLDLSKYLVRKGASTSAKTKAGRTPRDLAEGDEVRSFLKDCEKEPNKNASVNKKSGASQKGFHQSTEDNIECNLNVDNKGEGSENHGREKRKDDTEGTIEIKEPHIRKKSRVALNHLTAESDMQEDEE